MIHSTAIVSDKADLADDVAVGPYAVIGDDVVIASGTQIDSHVVINGPTKIGRDNHIYQFASIGDDPQDKKYANEPTRLIIGDRNTIREFCTISRGTTQDRGETVVGDDNWIMAYVHIAHDCVVGNKTVMANNTTLAGHVHVGDWVICGGFSGIHQFCKVGAHAFLGMYAGINRDVPAYTMVSGQPATPRGINSEGLKRRDFSADQIRNIKNAYRLTFRQGKKLNDAIEEISGLCESQPELNLFLESLRSSERGLVR
ncbi:MAG: acyl-ACP--UDP-N-acetylglucosamine O-acyltransferase [Gammaproteobacteria bacterium]|nr:acyl-ACP--UDP-N-acetylglucosamine O-acyltransferase [Gammaproteobacteria bacterium]MBT8109951.1 acyl-ACP--UDP-N-acetylglucosamine O-acyltransferase [Gammaproteobacteria bacterium]NND47581.1 acyl-ACP--UDP-N-acetylglucosamine O-acyltransferase [Woeseiaceae bacterium]NNL44653.1 acyl-ACP--UDP-N-acetylglucosamine O-acyltransferase [Woeseiaceae bacterium]